MKFLVAFDSFKESLSGFEVGEAVRAGIEIATPQESIRNCPISDGGEGSMEALLSNFHAEEKSVTVHDALMRPIVAKYLLLDKYTVFIESASCIGLANIPKEKRNLMKVTSFGLGEQMRDAILAGYRNLIISLGGSATNDGGLGMLQALGWEFYDANDQLIDTSTNPLLHVHSFSEQNKMPELKSCSITILSDVSSPFYGKEGAAFIYAGQKGATSEQILHLDCGLEKLANILKSKYDVDVQNIPGSGAAGGLGGSIVAALNGVMKSGIDTMIELTNLEKYIIQSDIIFTGEGSLDKQSLNGKVPIGVAQLAKKHNKMVIGLAGRVDTDLNEMNQYLDAFFSIQTECRTLEEALAKEITHLQLSKTAEQIVRLMNARIGIH
ncbi:glycerate kinase [Virgibacillus sp. Bac330]|uniref:glycerate kinase family protein n=1 Tax=Virgibacillus sp. Bac330 TaxID=2419841 RepID=UPI0013CF1C30|nr:glycerate kinase [Virgibacillus sp. Bac330]